MDAATRVAAPSIQAYTGMLAQSQTSSPYNSAKRVSRMSAPLRIALGNELDPTEERREADAGDEGRPDVDVHQLERLRRAGVQPAEREHADEVHGEHDREGGND